MLTCYLKHNDDIISLRYFSFLYSYERTVYDVCQVIHHAKLEDKDLRPVTQVLYFAEEFPEYKILELDKEIFKCLKESDKYVLVFLKLCSVKFVIPILY